MEKEMTDRNEHGKLVWETVISLIRGEPWDESLFQPEAIPILARRRPPRNWRR